MDAGAVAAAFYRPESQLLLPLFLFAIKLKKGKGLRKRTLTFGDTERQLDLLTNKSLLRPEHPRPEHPRPKH